jgi:hypothetical protein
MIEEKNSNKLGKSERPDSGEGTDVVPAQKIIEFDAGRKMLEPAYSTKVAHVLSRVFTDGTTEQMRFHVQRSS